VSQQLEDKKQKPPHDPERTLLFVLSLLVVLVVALMLARFVMDFTSEPGTSMDLIHSLS